MYRDVALSTYIRLKRLMWAGHIVKKEHHHMPKKVLGICFGEGQWIDHEIDEKMPYRGMQPTCSGCGTGRLQQEIRRSGGRRLGRPWPKNGPKHHRRRRFRASSFFVMIDLGKILNSEVPVFFSTECVITM
jgi:hypothetical protein